MYNLFPLFSYCVLTGTVSMALLRSLSTLPVAQKPLPPLLDSKHSVRLPLRFELCAFDLLDCPQYAALSYTWLDPFLHDHPGSSIDKDWNTHSGVIYCNDEPVSILPNLHEALQEVSICHDVLWLFIDALCINQHDEIEKANQVGLLTQIFSNAEHSICWLGPADKSMETCTMAVQTFYQILSQADRENASPLDLPIQHPRVMRHFSLGARSSTVLKKAVRAIALLGKRRWFSRVWVVQEFALSRDVYLFCGRHTIHSQQLRVVSRWLQRVSARFSDFTSLDMTRNEWRDTVKSIARIVDLTQAQDLASGPFFVDQLKLRYDVSEPMKLQAACLLDFLYRCRGCQALDERDRIYALSGLARVVSEDSPPSS